MTIANLNELFLHELKDLYDAEHQLVEALPKMAQAACEPQLADTFRHHLEETREHVARLEAVFATLGEEPERESCTGMKGLLDEGSKLMKEDAEDSVTDAALIGAAQRVEHYEIAAYGTLKAWAGTIGLEAAIEQLDQTLEEEKHADQTLTQIAEGKVNVEAEAEAEAEEEETAEEEPRERKSRAPAGKTNSRRSSSPAARATKPARSRRRTAKGR